MQSNYQVNAFSIKSILHRLLFPLYGTAINSWWTLILLVYTDLEYHNLFKSLGPKWLYFFFLHKTPRTTFISFAPKNLLIWISFNLTKVHSVKKKIKQEFYWNWNPQNIFKNYVVYYFKNWNLWIVSILYKQLCNVPSFKLKLFCVFVRWQRLWFKRLQLELNKTICSFPTNIATW